MSVQVQLRRDTYVNVAANHGAAGEIFVDTTNQRLVVQDGATNGGFPAPASLSVQNGGSVNNSISGSGSFVNHAPSFTIPANFMIAARAFRVTVHMQLTTGSVAPVLTHRLLLGSTVIGTCGAIAAPTASQTNVGFVIQWIFQATQAPSASSNVQCAMITGPNGGGSSAQVNSTAMPVAVATNAAQAITIATQWTTAGTGTNTIALNQFILEALN